MVHPVPVDSETRERMEVLTDPVAMQMWQGLLRSPMTGGQLRAHIGEGLRNLAWHMRQMERVDLVTSDDEGNVSSRSWRATSVRLEWDVAESERDQRVIRMFERSLLNYRESVERRWTNEKHTETWAPEWVDAEISDDYRLSLSADQLNDLRHELGEVLRRYKEEVDPADGGSEHVTVFITGHPLRVGGGTHRG